MKISYVVLFIWGVIFLNQANENNILIAVYGDEIEIWNVNRKLRVKLKVIFSKCMYVLVLCCGSQNPIFCWS